MSNKSNKGNNSADAPAIVETPATDAATTVNHLLTYRRDHPGDRCSYGIAGNSGIVVFDKGLFVGGVAPATITVDCDLVPVKADNKAQREEAKVKAAAERAEKAQAKIIAAQARAEEKQRKAGEALEKAQAKLKAAADAKAAEAAKVDATAQ